jgi:hypothetical protein
VDVALLAEPAAAAGAPGGWQMWTRAKRWSPWSARLSALADANAPAAGARG